jgi:hypothetical protein
MLKTTRIIYYAGTTQVVLRSERIPIVLHVLAEMCSSGILRADDLACTYYA